MKRALLIIPLLIISNFLFAQESKTQLQLHSFAESKSEGGMENLGVFFQKGWPKDINGDKECAWVRVTFENLTDADAEDVIFNFGNSAPTVEVKNRLKEAEKEIWLFVTPSANAIMEAALSKYGKSNRLPNIKLEPRHVYDVVLKNDKTLSINVTTKPDGVRAALETGQYAITPATIADVAMGRHTLTLSKDGQTLGQEEIVVTEHNVRFEYDLRKKRSIVFASDPSDAYFYINDKEMGKTPITLELPYDSYNVEAILGPTEKDSRAITVNEHTPSRIVLEPVKKRNFEVVAVYGGSKVNADLYLDGKRIGKNKPSYSFTEPIGKTCNITMTYGGHSKEKKIVVKPKMANVQTIKISAKNYIVWPWQRQYDVTPMGLSLGYVTKQLITRGEGEKFHEDGAWHKDGKYLHGFQVGLHYQPCFSFGLGAYTGLFYEFYYSKFSGAAENEFDEFMEHCIYIPAHLYYRVPFAQKTALVLHGGLGFNYSVEGEYKCGDSGLDDITDFYGELGYPKRLNIAAEIAVGMRLGSVQLNFQYSKGISNHKSYESLGAFKTTQNKMSVGLSYVFGGD